MRGTGESATPVSAERQLRLRPELVILCGVPGVGKSTWVRANARNHRVIASDAIRREVYGSLADAHKQASEEERKQAKAEVFAEFHRRIEAELAAGHDVIADATSVLSSAREELVGIAAAAGARTRLVVFREGFPEARKRNRSRDKDQIVPKKVMQEMDKEFRATLKSLDGSETDTYDTVEFV